MSPSFTNFDICFVYSHFHDVIEFASGDLISLNFASIFTFTRQKTRKVCTPNNEVTSLKPVFHAVKYDSVPPFVFVFPLKNNCDTLL